MPGAAGQQRPFRQRGSQVPRQGARIETIRRRIEPVRRRVEHRPGRRGSETFLANLTRFQRLVDRGHRLASITLHIQARNDADLLGHRLDVDARNLGRGKQQSAFGGVVAKLRADTQHEVGVGQQLLRRRRGERAGDADVPRMAREIAFALQRGRQQRADAVGQFDDLVLRVGRHSRRGRR